MHVNRGPFADLLGPCLDEVRSASSSRPPPYLYLGATAGMRLLRLEDNRTADGLVDAARRAAVGAGFRVEREEDVAVLEGRMEGAYAWVTSNYAAGDLKAGRVVVGALDMGGASAQLAAQLPSGNNIVVDILGNDFEVYSVSHLCYGINEAARRFTASLVADALVAKGPPRGGPTLTVKDPCLAGGGGERVAYDLHDLFDSTPCVRLRNETARSAVEGYMRINRRVVAEPAASSGGARRVPRPCRQIYVVPRAV